MIQTGSSAERLVLHDLASYGRELIGKWEGFADAWLMIR